MTRRCASCGCLKGLTRFENESVMVTNGRLRTELAGLSGWLCAARDEVVFDTDSARRHAETGDALVNRSRGRRHRTGVRGVA